MLKDSYANLSGAEKLGLLEVVNSSILIQLIDMEVENVKHQLIHCVPGPGMELEYAIVQQRLISLGDLKNFFKSVKSELMPQTNTE